MLIDMLPIEQTLEKTKFRDYTMGSVFMGKKKFTIEEKIKAVELHIREGDGVWRNFG